MDSLNVYLPADKAGLIADGVVDVQGWRTGSPSTTRSWLARALSRATPDVIFIPTSRYLSAGIPTVTMVRNMEPLVAPFSPRSPLEVAKNLLRRRATHQTCRRATRCIAVSEHVAAYLRGRIGRDFDVVHHGVGRLATPAPPQVPIQQPFLFTAGSLRPARNLEDIIDGFALLHARGSAHVTLVIAGSSTRATRWYEDSMRRRAFSAGIGERICWVGELTESEMAWCYANATAFVMTSRIEACPNTVLESMISKTPSISIELPPMTELYGENALYYPAGDPAALVGQIEHLVADASVQDVLGGAASIRAERCFKWERTARLTIDVLERSVRGVARE